MKDWPQQILRQTPEEYGVAKLHEVIWIFLTGGQAYFEKSVQTDFVFVFEVVGCSSEYSFPVMGRSLE